MSIRDSKLCLIVKDGMTGNATVVENFMDYSSYTQRDIIEDLVCPLLFDKRGVYLSLGEKP